MALVSEVFASTCPTCFYHAIVFIWLSKALFRNSSFSRMSTWGGKRKEWIMEERKKGQTPTTPQVRSIAKLRLVLLVPAERHEHTHTPAYTLAFYATKKVDSLTSESSPVSVLAQAFLHYSASGSRIWNVEVLRKSSLFQQVGRHWRVVVKFNIRVGEFCVTVLLKKPFLDCSFVSCNLQFFDSSAERRRRHHWTRPKSKKGRREKTGKRKHNNNQPDKRPLAKFAVQHLIIDIGPKSEATKATHWFGVDAFF